MPSDSPPAAAPAPDVPLSSTAQAPPSVIALAFPFARRAIVERHRWMTADEFNEAFALCHFLPGPNIVNLSFVFGARFRGFVGGLAAFTGLIGPPMIVVSVLGVLYMHYGEIAALRRILSGISCAAIGLLVATVFRMLMPLLQRRDIAALLLMVAVFVAIGPARLPLQMVLLVAAPVSFAVVFLKRRALP
jgi:chromate transporter